MHVHGAVLPGVGIAPDLVEQLLPAVHPLGVLHEQLQQVELPGGELHRDPFLPGAPGGAVDGESPQGEFSRLFLLLLPPGGRGPAEQGLHPGLDLQNVEGLGDIVVRPVLKAQELVRVLPPGGEHDDGHGGKGTDLHAGLQAVQLRHHQVQNNEVILRGPGHVHRLAAVVAHVHLVSLVLQVEPDALDHNLFVIYH